MEENKKDIVEKLEILLKATRAGRYITALELSEDADNVVIVFNGGFRRNVNVEADSGIEVVRDVIRAL